MANKVEFFTAILHSYADSTGLPGNGVRLLDVPQSDRFFADYAAHRGVALATHWYLDGRHKTRAARIPRMLRVAPSVWVWVSLYVLSRKFDERAIAA